MPEHGTKIEWTHVPGYTGATWNPTTGCSHVSDGCVNCYAEELARGRLKGSPGYPGLPWTAGNADVNVITHDDRLDQPLRWTKPRAVFVNSMSDLFHENIPDEFLDRVFAVMALTPQHIYMVLTKRPERMRDYLGGSNGLPMELVTRWLEAAAEISAPGTMLPLGTMIEGGVLKNLWLGVSAERQRELDLRVPLLLDTPAAVRFVSAEPLLGPLQFRECYHGDPGEAHHGWLPSSTCSQITTLSWIIVGGESGPKRRPMELDWLYDIVRQCRRAGIPAFVKQDAAHRPGQQGRIGDIWWVEKHWPVVA